MWDECNGELFSLLGGEDFVAFRRILTVPIGIRRRCVAITILEDPMPESDESFELAVEELGISTTITILDDEGMIWHTMIYRN